MSRIPVVQPGFGVVVVPTVAEGVIGRDTIIGKYLLISVSYGTITPSIVLIRNDLASRCGAVDTHDIPEIIGIVRVVMPYALIVGNAVLFKVNGR